MKKYKPFVLIALCFVFVFASFGCSGNYVVRHNVQVAANDFEVCRKLTAYNARTDTVILSVEGFFSLSNNGTDELEIVCKVSEDSYKLHYLYLNEFVLYVVEDISGANVDQYHYDIHYYFPVPDIEVN